jgi:hypothetical protein
MYGLPAASERSHHERCAATNAGGRHAAMHLRSRNRLAVSAAHRGLKVRIIFGTSVEAAKRDLM